MPLVGIIIPYSGDTDTICLMVVSSKKVQKKNSVTNSSYFRTLVLLVVLLILGVVWLIIHFNYNPQQVFSSMLSNSLSTTTFSKQVTQISNGTTTKQSEIIQTGANNIAISKETQIGQGVNAGRTVIINIGTPSTDYSSVSAIYTTQRNKKGQLMNYSPVIGIWSKNTPGGKNATDGQVFTAALLGSIIPVGHVTPSQRAQLLSYIKQKKLYGFVGNVDKHSTSGRMQFTYRVNVNLQSLATLLHQFGTDLGLKLPAVVTTGVDQETTTANITVDVLSRHLVSVSYIGSQTNEQFSTFGTKLSVNIPTKTIPLSQLEAKISAIGSS